MEWIVLIVLVPAVIVPVVLLFGFAGCASIIGAEDLVIVPVPPENLPLPPAVPPTATQQWRPVYDGRLSATDPFVAVELLAGSCLVQGLLLPPSPWLTNATKIRVTVRAQSPLTITGAFVGKGAVLWDFDPTDFDPTSSRNILALGGVTAGIPVPANSPVLLTADYGPVDHTVPLLIAFDISTGNGLMLTKLAKPTKLSPWTPPVLQLPVTVTDDCVAFIKPGAAAGNIPRGWPLPGKPGAPTLENDSVVLIEKIEVLAL
jgi:hypothetical protein